MHATREASTPGTCRRPEVQALRQELQQMHAALQELSEQNRSLREHQQEIDRKLAELGAAATPITKEATVAVAPAGSVTPNASPLANSPPMQNPSALPDASAIPANGSLVNALGNGLRLWGYGEIYYTHPTREPQESQFDLARAVFGIGYRFDERTEFNSEYEVEHAVTSASDVGEFDVEQFYIDRRLNDA